MDCTDQMVLQRLLDGELDAAQARGISRHLESCAHCRAAAKRLTEVRAFVQESLGAEDEAEEDASAAALAAVGRLFPQAEPGRRREAHRVAPGWVRRTWLAVAAVAIVILLPVLFTSRVGASADRILELADARERMWQYQPNRTLHWEVEAVSKDVKGLADGTWVSHYWQKNGASTFAQIWRQFDPQGRVARATWRRDDGSAINYRPNGREVVEVIPSTATLRAALPTLAPDLGEALEVYLQRSESSRSLDFNSRRREAEWLNRPAPGTSGGKATLRTGRVAEWGEVYHITVVNDRFTRNPAIVRAVHEYDVEKSTFRLLRLKSTVGYADGTTGVHESRWVRFKEIASEEFEGQMPSDLLEGGTPVIYLTPRELATRFSQDLNRVRQAPQ